MTEDKNGKPIELRDYVAKEIVGVQLGTEGHRLWVYIDGVAVLRVKSPKIELAGPIVDELADAYERIYKLEHGAD